MHLNKKTRIIAAIGALLIPHLGMAAEAVEGEKSANYNMTLLSLIGLMIILLFVIGVLGSTLRQLSFVVREKMKKERQSGSGIAKSIVAILLFTGMSFSALAQGAEEVKVPEPASISGIATSDFYLIISIIGLELLVIFALTIYINILLKIIKSNPETEAAAKSAPKRSWFWDNFNSAASIEKEKDVLLDHNYDGIQELDNSLPPWWKYGFYLTIVIGIIYLYRYHVSHDAPSSQEEYAAEMQKGEEAKAAYLAKSANNVDENNVIVLNEAADLSAGKEVFIKNCAPCHLADGGGTVGPNLTDDYWLHGGGIKDIFKSIKYGWQDKGMKSWKDDMSPRQIQQVSSFIKSLKGTHPATPKAPQGELYVEATDVKTDSVEIKTDTTKVK